MSVGKPRVRQLPITGDHTAYEVSHRGWVEKVSVAARGGTQATANQAATSIQRLICLIERWSATKHPL